MEAKTLGRSLGNIYFLGTSPRPTHGGPWAQTPSGPVRGSTRERMSAEQFRGLCEGSARRNVPPQKPRK